LDDEETNPRTADWLIAGGVPVSGDALMLELKLGPSAEFLSQLARRKVASAMRLRLGIAISEKELDEAVAAFYAERKLFGPQQLLDWRHSMRIEEGAIREYVRETLLTPRLREKLISDAMVRAQFAINPHQYARAEVEVFTFSSEGAAREFVLAVRERELESIHGARRWFMRRETSEEAGALIFSAEPGELVGPVEIDYQCCEVYRVLNRQHPSLDAQLHRQIGDELFDELINAELVRHPFAFLA
jgi:hypothetical protein